MKKANIAALRSQLSSLLQYVQKGREVEIQKRNISIAKIIPMKAYHHNRTKLGIGRGTVKFEGNILESMMDEDWDMHK